MMMHLIQVEAGQPNNAPTWICNLIFYFNLFKCFWNNFNNDKGVGLMLIRSPSFNSRLGIFSV